MNSRAKSPAALVLRSVRAMIAPLTDELARLTEEAAIITAMAGRPNVSESDGREILRRVAETNAALFRLEQQLNGALVGQPPEITEHGRIRDLRLSIKAIQTRLQSLGA